MKKTGIISAVIYIGIASLAAGLFWLAALGGTYTAMDKIGGSVWVFILSIIILMPVVITFVKKRIND